MAYSGNRGGQRSGGNGNKTAGRGNATRGGNAGAASDSPWTKVTGLFVRKFDDGNESISVAVSEDITIPAGTYLHLFRNDKKKSDSSPDYSLAYKAMDQQ